MPYCCQCGKETRATDQFCGVCGTRQPVAPPAAESISPRTASMLCYIPVVGWIPSVIVLASQRFRQDKVVRFHAFQGIFLFVIWLIVDWFLGPVTGLTMMHGWRQPWGVGLPMISMVAFLKLAIFAAWIVMLIKTGKGEQYRLPILGELAERTVAEQK